MFRKVLNLLNFGDFAAVIPATSNSRPIEVFESRPQLWLEFLGEMDQKLGRGRDFRAVGSRPNSEDLPRKQAQQLLVQEQRNAARYSKTQQGQQRRVGQR